jgi:hypothetical protein
MSDIPRQSSQITLDWLNKVLKPDDLFSAFSVEIIGGGAGVMGELSRVTLESQHSKSSVIAKFASPVPEAREVAGALRFYEMESRFYTDLAAQVDITKPVCFFNDYQAETQLCTLLLSDVEGEVVDQVTGCSPERAAETLKQIAKVHAWGYSSPWRDKASFVRPLNEADWVHNGRAALEANLPVSMEKMGDLFPDWLTELAPTFSTRIPDIGNRLDSFPATLLHGDLRADNLIFSDKEELTLLDWQLIFDGPGAYDVGYFLSQSLTIEDRRKHEATLINEYCDAMESHGVRVVRDEFDECYRLSILNCLGYALVGGGVIDENFDRSIKLATAMLTRSCAAIEDHNCLDLL